MTPNELNVLLIQNADHVLQMLLPGGVVQGNDFVAGSVHGEAGLSLKAHLSGTHAGNWRDWATGEHGDLIDLWKSAKGLSSMAETLADVKSFLNIRETAPTFYGEPKRLVLPEKPKCHAIVRETTIWDWFTENRCIPETTLQCMKLAEDNGVIGFPYCHPSQAVPAQSPSGRTRA